MASQVYKHINSKGELLYVGVTDNIFLRNNAHKTKCHWYKEISRIEIEHYDTRSIALKKEALYIAELKPKHNLKSMNKNVKTQSIEEFIERAKLIKNKRWKDCTEIGLPIIALHIAAKMGFINRREKPGNKYLFQFRQFNDPNRFYLINNKGY